MSLRAHKTRLMIIESRSDEARSIQSTALPGNLMSSRTPLGSPKSWYGVSWVPISTHIIGRSAVKISHQCWRIKFCFHGEENFREKLWCKPF